MKCDDLCISRTYNDYRVLRRWHVVVPVREGRMAAALGETVDVSVFHIGSVEEGDSQI